MTKQRKKIRAIDVNGKEFRIYRDIYQDGPTLNEIICEDLPTQDYIRFFGKDKEGNILFEIKTTHAIIYYA